MTQDATHAQPVSGAENWQALHSGLRSFEMTIHILVGCECPKNIVIPHNKVYKLRGMTTGGNRSGSAYQDDRFRGEFLPALTLLTWRIGRWW